MADKKPKSGGSRKERRASARAGKEHAPKRKTDADSSIRADFRKTTEMPISLEKALGAVAQLSHADSGPDHYEDFQREANMERADRGAAILLALNVENALERTIVRSLNPPTARRDLFGLQAPMGSFAHKIIMGHAIGVYGSETRTNLDIIRTIRNTFAHAKHPIRFGDDEMVVLVNFLVVQKKLIVLATTRINLSYRPVTRVTDTVPDLLRQPDSSLIRL
jgi:hypothetical protein